MKLNVKKCLSAIILVFSLAFLFWFIISFLEVIKNNVDTAAYSDWNLLVLALKVTR